MQFQLKVKKLVRVLPHLLFNLKTFSQNDEVKIYNFVHKPYIWSHFIKKITSLFKKTLVLWEWFVRCFVEWDNNLDKGGPTLRRHPGRMLSKSGIRKYYQFSAQIKSKC